MEKNPAVRRAIDILGGPVAAARALGARNYQTVQRWIDAGQVPARYCLAVEERTGVCRAELRPDDHHLIWRDLPASVDGAPSHA